MSFLSILQGLCLVVMFAIAVCAFLLNIAPFVPIALLMFVIMIAEGVRK